MRKFIVSDLHGNGNVYNSIMQYLENINIDDKVELFINGDLIDRGIDSVDMLLDVKKRILNGSFKINYLGGNHELMMFQMYQKRIKGLSTYNDIWFENGGDITSDLLEENLSDKDKILEVIDFISNLNIYNRFEEKINNKNIVLVHAACPFDVKETCDLKIKNDNSEVEYCLWTREYDPFIPFRCRVGDEKYFSIIGHTPNDNKYGFEYHKSQNYFNIDGGSARYVSGFYEYNHIPLVEVKQNYLKMLTFNNDNQIIYGNYFIDNNVVPFSEQELKNEIQYLNKEIKTRKLKY